VVIAGLDAAATPARVRVTLRARGEAIAPGQRVSLRAVLLPPAAPAAPGAFDFARQAWFEGIGAVGYAVTTATVLKPAQPGFEDAIAALRHRLSQRIHAVLDGQTGAVASALTTGERASIDDETWAELRDSGLAHIISISGLHFALLAGILVFTTRAGLALIEPIALRYPIKKWAAAAALAGCFGYFLLAGATAPTERSFLMLGLAMLAILLDRRPFSMRLVAWAAVAVLLVSPHSVLGPSFQMSFAAVVALIATYDLTRGAFSRWGRNAGVARTAILYLCGVGLSTLVAGLATAPYALYHFDRFSTYSLAANLVAVPITGLWIMPWAVTAFALMPFGLEALALHPMGWGIDAMLGVGKVVAAWPGAAVTLPAMAPAGLALVTAGGLWLCVWQTRWRLAGVPVLLLGLTSAVFVARPTVLVSEDATYMAVRAADGGMWVSSARANFTVETWLRRDGLEAGGRWPASGTATADGRLRCDRLACLYRAEGVTVALVREEEALAEDCRAADVVIAAVAVFVPCPARVVIDRLDVWREGAHAVWIEDGEVRVRTVADTRGRRPWVLPRPDYE
jgi:competence protein ComEC